MPYEKIGKDILFIYDAKYIDVKSKESIGSFLRDKVIITVYYK